MKLLIALLILGLAGFLAYRWTFKETPSTDLERAQRRLAEGAEHARDKFRDGLEEFSLDTGKVREELAQSGRVVRRKASDLGRKVADATEDIRITGAIKAKLVADPRLSALGISVDTTDGVVTLSGRVNQAEDIQRAMLLALETDGVREVISTLRLPEREKAPDE